MALPALKLEEEVSMEGHVAHFESDVQHIRSDIADTKTDIRGLRCETKEMDQRLSSKIDDADRRLSSKLDEADRRLTSKIDEADRRLSSKIDDVKSSIVALDRRMLKLAGGLRLRLQKFEVTAAKRETFLLWKLTGLILGALAAMFGLLKWLDGVS